jgi:DNA repair protein RadC|tara:strand:+ start:306 stop:998 length:693 start_codon:yes stop_codon:yes gene_type:complete
LADYISIKNWSEDDKPREKLAANGRETLSNAELLGILIGNGTRSKSAVDLARDVLSLANNDINTLAKLSIKDLCTINGIGPAKAITLMAAIELGGRRKKAETNDSFIRKSKDAYDFFGPMLQDKDYEEFWILMLNNNNKILRPYRVSEGGVSQTVADPKRIYKAALENNASQLILCHNHPSGNLQPSPADRSLTSKLIAAGKNLDIKVIDHIIVTDGGYYSFADEGLIPT